MVKKARCPASCGELIQGFVNGVEMLVSLPINMYSTVTVSNDADNCAGHRKTYKSYEAVGNYLSSIEEKANFNISIDSDIPIGKGMASSTADIAAAIVACAAHFNKRPTEAEIAKYCVDIEPTDSTVFSKMTLFDHLKGEHQEILGDFLYTPIMVLEGNFKVNTINLRRNKNYKKKVRDITEIYFLLKSGIIEKDIEKISKAAKQSAILNQELLRKPYLESLIAECEQLKNKVYGLNIAHSGSVVGIWLKDANFFEELEYILLKKYNDFFGNSFLVNTTNGGVERME